MLLGFCAGAIAATTDEGDVPDVDLEAILAPQGIGDRGGTSFDFDCSGRNYWPTWMHGGLPGCAGVLATQSTTDKAAYSTVTCTSGKSGSGTRTPDRVR